MLTAYRRLPAGPGYSTVLPCLDFETYSEAGYYQSADGKWHGITKTSPGLEAVGAPAYSEHSSTIILSLAYDLKAGRGPQLWTPDCPPPHDLFAHLQSGGLLEAWNSAFEYHIWLNVAHRRMGWPPLPHHQLRDAMAKSRAHSLPGKLEKAAEVIQAAEQKDATGKALLRKLSVPQQPTSKRPGGRCTDSAALAALYSYNVQDIKAEAAVSGRCPDLSAYEQRVWLLDQEINFRGVHIDQAALQDCISIIRQAEVKYTAELQAITRGTVQSAGELAKLTGWLGANGCHMHSLDADAVEAALRRDGLTPACRRVLEIRSLLGAAAVKKLFAIERRLSSDGRLRDLFAYCGADRTGRWAGRGPQPQNMPGGKPTEEVESILAVMATRNLAAVEAACGDPVAAVSDCLRGLFSAAPGYDLICSDFSAIEAVVLAEQAGETWRQEVFRTHGKIYEASAAAITGIPFEEFMRYKQETGQHHPLRKKVGKVAELACFTRNTQVLTKSGLKRIVDITDVDFLWDGVEWVKSNGVKYRGKRIIINVDGVEVTPEHPISLGDSWREAKLLVSNKNILRQALAFGSASIPLFDMSSETNGAGLSVNVAVGQKDLWTFLTSTPERLPAVANVVEKNRKKRGLNYTQNTRIFCLIQSIGGGLLTDLEQLLRGATLLTTTGTKIMVAEALRFAKRGAVKMAQGHFSVTCSLCPVGITPASTWTESIPMVGTNPEIFALSAEPKMHSTNEVSLSCKNESMNLKDVYDIANVGPRHRFMIKTDSGYLLVHNSGYQGAVGAWKAFGADEFMTDDEILANVKAWRRASPMIVKFWYGLQDAAHLAVQYPGHCYSYQAPATRYGQPPAFTFGVKDDILYCRLPSGRNLTYHTPRLEPSVTYSGKPCVQLTYMGWNSNYLNGPVGWMRLSTHGGKICENATQSVARDILANSMLALSQVGYQTVLHVHDEIVAEVRHGWGSVEEFESIMSRMPAWAAGWPVRAAGGWRGRRYRKE